MESIAFPSSAPDVAQVVLKRLVGSKSFSPNSLYTVVVAGEMVHIPHRIYCSKFTLLRSVLAGGVSGTMALCLGTRHHDGYVRERCIRQLLNASEEWVIPYVIQLLGEYVMEIAAHIEQALPHLNKMHYARFVRENREYFAKTECRAISYWNEYYRRRIVHREQFPALRVIAALKRIY